MTRPFTITAAASVTPETIAVTDADSFTPPWLLALQPGIPVTPNRAERRMGMRRQKHKRRK